MVATLGSSQHAGILLTPVSADGRACVTPHHSNQSIGSSDITSTLKRRQPEVPGSVW